MMKLCKDCGSEMNYVMSFQMENNKVKQVGYYVCKKCRNSTRPAKLLLK